MPATVSMSQFCKEDIKCMNSLYLHPFCKESYQRTPNRTCNITLTNTVLNMHIWDRL